MIRARQLVLTGVAGTALALSACGSKKEESPPAPTGPGAPKGATSAAGAIQEFFTAKRLGEAEKGCALESESFQTTQYGGVGEPCLMEAANKRPQAVWAEKTTVVKLVETGDSATATIRPNAGSDAPAIIALVKLDGRWLVDGLR